MKKSYIHTLVILLAIITIGIVSSVTDNKYITKVYAYVSGYIPVTPTFYWVSPFTVNDFDTNHGPVVMGYPPLGSEVDYTGWQKSYFGAVPYPTPQISDCANNACPSPIGDTMIPGTAHNSGFLRVEWTGSNNNDPQYIHLTNYAQATPGSYGMNFQNVNCNGGLVSGLVTLTASTSGTFGDWGCYGYMRLYLYNNFGANNGSQSAVSQTVMLFDGSMTITTGAITAESLGGPSLWVNHLTVSLNYLSNQYNNVTGRYFSVTNITDVIIPASGTDFTGRLAPANPAAFSPGAGSLFMYYDWLVLGDSTAVPAYQSPSNISVTTAFGPGPIGAYIDWTAIDPATYGASNTITAYHIYRSKISSPGTPGVPGTGGPYISVAIVPVNPVAPMNVSSYVDTLVPGGSVYCYKVLTCNNGPTINAPDEKYNTINASYHEPRLNDTIVIEKCGYVAARPTFTPTPPPYIGTPTITPTQGPPTGDVNIKDAHVYPNPFNPNAGSGFFHVGNVKIGTKIHIYAMDGMLVKDGVYSEGLAFTWNGKNKNGSKVVSGLYYLVLEDPQHKTAVFRIIVCYKCDPVYHAPTP